MTEKKCSNCHWYHEDSRGIGIGACLNMNSERMCSGNYFPCTHAKNYPCNHHALETSTLEQRYQQLAEITRDLWQFIADRAPNNAFLNYCSTYCWNNNSERNHIGCFLGFAICNHYWSVV